MKKIFLMIFAASVAFCYSPRAEAQAAFNHTAFNPTGAITNAGVDTQSIRLTKGYDLITVSVAVVRSSGTLAGTSILSYSVNGTDYFDTDTLTLSNVVRKAIAWTKAIPARYWRIITTGSGTMTALTSARVQTD